MKNKVFTQSELRGHVFGVGEDHTYCDTYFWLRKPIPISFVPLDESRFAFYGISLGELVLPEKIEFELELFALGSIDGQRAFVFKPWLFEPEKWFYDTGFPLPLALMQEFTDWLLFIPDYLVQNMMLQNIFVDCFTLQELKGIRIFQDIELNRWVSEGFLHEDVIFRHDLKLEWALENGGVKFKIDDEYAAKFHDYLT
jgi:hypothetical protein